MVLATRGPVMQLERLPRGIQADGAFATRGRQRFWWTIWRATVNNAVAIGMAGPMALPCLSPEASYTA